MFSKLLKYDLRYIYKILGVYYIVTIGCALVGKAAALIPNPSPLVDFIGIFFRNASLGLCIGLIINAVTRTWARFQQSLYGDESYLTHTLPVSRPELFGSKFASTIITLLLSFIISIIIIWLLLSDGSFNLSSILPFGANSSISEPAFIAIFILATFAQLTLIIQCGFFGILVGHRSHTRRALWSTIAGFAAYVTLEAVLLLSVLLWSQFNPSINSLIASGHQLNIDDMFLFLVIVTVIYTVLIAITYLVNNQLLKRGVDVE